MSCQLIKTVFIRIMEIQCKYAKNNNFCLNFRNPLWESSSEAERKREREERFLKGERDNWGLERERQERGEWSVTKSPRRAGPPRPDAKLIVSP